METYSGILGDHLQRHRGQDHLWPLAVEMSETRNRSCQLAYYVFTGRPGVYLRIVL